MKKLVLYPEAYSPTGNVTSAGILNQLGRPKLDMLAVLVRESVQNSWDARDRNRSSIQYGISGWTLSNEQRKILTDIVFAECPPELGLNNVLASAKEIQLLAIYDRGTEGLGGPTRADVILDDRESGNFVDFLRNVGQPPDKQLSGGTYGYGKAVFYRVSMSHTILVHTHCLSQGERQSRFMGAALGSPFEYNRQRYTGRHWWGQVENEVIEPVLAQESDLLASSLGFPSFQNNELGTTIVIIQPIWDDRTPEDALRLMSEYLLWYFWPKMLESENGKPPIEFEIFWEGKQIVIPKPQDFPPLKGFVQAMRRLKSPSGEQILGLSETYAITTNQYNQYLGRLALERFPLEKRTPRVGQEAVSPIPNASHHVALMRQPELVVRYLEGPELSSSQIEYAGVFITDAEVDRVFADAEPPTHDDWIANFLTERRQKVYVNTALREIKNKLYEFVRPGSTQTIPGDLAPLGAFANQLGTLLPGQPGNAAFSNLFVRRRSLRTNETRSLDALDPAKPPISTDVSGISREVASTSNLISNAADLDTISPEFNKATNFGKENQSSDTVAPPLSGSMRSLSDYATTNNTYSLDKPSNFSNYTQSSSTMPKSIPGTPNSNSSALIQRPGKVRIGRIEEGELMILEDASPALRIEFELIFSGRPCTAQIEAIVGAVLDGGEIETDPPQGSEIPQILWWEDQYGQRYHGNKEIGISSLLGGVWFIVVSVPEYTLVGVELKSSFVQNTSEV